MSTQSDPPSTMMATKRTTTRGPQGAPGLKGERGATGPTGPTGPRGPSIEHAEVLAVVDSELGEIRKHFEMQIARTAQIQRRLDEIHDLLRQLMGRR